MAAVPITAKTTIGRFTPSTILLATSGDTLAYTAGSSQELHLYNTDVSSIDVVIDGSGGTTVTIPNTGGATTSVASGVTYAVAAGAAAIVRLDTISAYLTGVVAITAATGAKVVAYIVKP